MRTLIITLVLASLLGTPAFGKTTQAKTPLPVAVSSIKLKPSSVTGGQKSTGTVTIQVVAPQNVLIYLGSSNTAVATVGSSSITIPKGKASGNFTVITKKATSKKTVAISAIAQGSTTKVSVNLTVTK
jgi:hypothetical protein